MKRSQGFLWVNFLLIVVSAFSFFYATKSMRNTKNGKALNFEKEAAFRKDAALLDSLYKGYVLTLANSDQSKIAEDEAALTDQISRLKRNYTGSSAPAMLASKFIRNYQFRILLKQKLLARNNKKIEDAGRIKSMIKELTIRNQELKTQNQMVEQAILNLP